jgi:thiamine biosynthesis protein ThiS
MDGTIGIIVNGETRRAGAGARLTDLLADLHLPSGKVAVEINREIVPRSSFAVQALTEGDRIEIVHFVGGG